MQSDDAETVWDVIASCGSQLRVAGFGRAFALDYGAVMMVAQARHADVSVLAEVLQDVERAVLAGHQEEPETEEGDDG